MTPSSPPARLRRAAAAAAAILLAAGWAAPRAHAEPAARSFSDLFTGATLRIDLHHSGSSASESYTLDGLKEEGSWAGPRAIPERATPYGSYIFEMYDGASNDLIYSRAFSSLFGEWRTTGEGQKLRRTMHETILAPMPKSRVYARLATRGPNNVFVDLASWEIDPASGAVRREALCVPKPLIDLAVTGPSSERLDILFVGEGYTETEAEKFRRDARRLSRILMSYSPFLENADLINIRALWAPSQQTGTDEPRKGIYRKTAVGTSFNTFDVERYLTAGDDRKLRDLVACAPYERIIVLVNSARYGGAGIQDQWAVTTTDNEFSDYVMVHEFGHSLAGLGDEYYTSEVAYNEFYPRGIEPWEANISALVPDGKPKWAAMLTPGVPIPTPPDQDKYAGVVGAFEGAGYAAVGLYRPSLDCMMFSKGYAPFDPVCSAALAETIRYLATGSAR